MAIDNNILLEQYKLFVGTSERNSDRRASSNKYFLSINSIILGLSGYAIGLTFQLWHLVSSLLGIILCVYWLLTLKSYRGLNSAKFKVIHNIEEKLPVKLFKDEWDYMDRGTNPKKYLKLSVLEQGIPILFSLLYITIFLVKIFEIIS